MLLKTEDLTIKFGGLVAVNKVNFNVNKGEIFGLIGPNGSGKTTTFNILTGLYAPTSGKVILNDEDVSGLKPNVVTRKGISRTFQNIRLFSQLSVFENVLIGCHSTMQNTILDTALRNKKSLYEEKKAVEKSKELMEFFGINKISQEKARNLPYGMQRRLEIVRALATDPKLLLLDEPAAGMNPHETAELMKLISKVQERDITILLVEHDMKLVMSICDRIVVLNYGNKIAEGKASEIQKNEDVIKAYLGGKGK